MMQETYTPPADAAATQISAAPQTMTGLTSTWCPGCGHGTFTQILSDVIAELGIQHEIIMSVGVGCGTSIVQQLNLHSIVCPHGRASDTATGLARMLPARIVVQYSGDGDACGIGLAGLMHACNRRENFLVFIYNNNVYGMTGGQMGPTTSKEVHTTTFQSGREEDVMGYPMDIVQTVADYPGVAYAARVALTSGVRYQQARKVVKRALEIHRLGSKG